MLRLGKHREHIPLNGVRAPQLSTVEDVFITLPDGTGTDRLQVGATVGFGQGNPSAQLARGEAWQAGLLHRLGAEALNDAAHDEVGVEDA